jgi:hypothetical protein
MIWNPERTNRRCQDDKTVYCSGPEGCSKWTWVVPGHLGGCAPQVEAARGLEVDNPVKKHTICLCCYKVSCVTGLDRCEGYDGQTVDVPEWVLRAINLEDMSFWIA